MPKQPRNLTHGELTVGDDESTLDGRDLSRNYRDLLQEVTAAGSWEGLEELSCRARCRPDNS